MRLQFRNHALKRLFERGFTIADIEQVLETGEIIKEYPDDKPYPSRLVLGWSRGRPIHLVAADGPGDVTFVITLYEPDPAQWLADLKTKRKKRRGRK